MMSEYDVMEARTTSTIWQAQRQGSRPSAFELRRTSRSCACRLAPRTQGDGCPVVAVSGLGALHMAGAAPPGAPSPSSVDDDACGLWPLFSISFE